MRSYEDFKVGEIIDLGSIAVTADDIKAFAAEFDPQPMHLEDAAAQNAIVGGLVASGMHIICLHMRLLVDGLLHDATSMGSPGVEEVRYLAPMRPGDRLAARLEVIDLRISKSRPEMGIMKFRSQMTNATGTAVMRMTSTVMLGRRAPAAT